MKVKPNDPVQLLGKNYVKGQRTPCLKCILINDDLLDYTINDGHTICEFCNYYCSYNEYPVLSL